MGPPGEGWGGSHRPTSGLHPWPVSLAWFGTLDTTRLTSRAPVSTESMETVRELFGSGSIWEGKLKDRKKPSGMSTKHNV